MNKYLIFYIILSFGINEAHSQNITIQYLYKRNEYFKDSFYFKLYKPIDGNVKSKSLEIIPTKIEYSKKDDTLKSIFTYYINDTITVSLGEGWGHQIILLPIDDTLTVIMGNKLESNPYSKDSLLIPWNYRFEYRSRYKAIYQLFDSLDVSAGSTHFDRVSSKNIYSGVDVFFEMCTKKYQKRIIFLNDYSLKNNIPIGVKNLVYQEIKSAYLLNLLQALIPGLNKLSNSQFPKEFLDSLKGYSFNDNVSFLRSRLYAKAAYQYAIFYLGKLKTEFKDKIDFINTYQAIKKSYGGDIRNYCLTNLLSSFIMGNNSKADSLINDFKTFCLDSNAVSYVDSLRSASINKNKISFKDVLNTSIYSDLKGEMKIDMLIKGKPVLIDCWASWCNPCLAEMKDSKILQKIFRGKVDFIYLSFDMNKLYWMKKSDELGLTNSYLITNEFENNFAYYFNINSIPRYIIIDKNKRLVTDNAPRPCERKVLEKTLNRLLLK